MKLIVLLLLLVNHGTWQDHWETHWDERPMFVHWYDYHCSNINYHDAVLGGIEVVRIGFHREYNAYVMGEWGLNTRDFDEAQRYVEKKAWCD